MYRYTKVTKVTNRRTDLLRQERYGGQESTMEDRATTTMMTILERNQCFEFRLGYVTTKYIDAICQYVGFEHKFANSKGFRLNAVRSQLLRQSSVSNSLAVRDRSYDDNQEAARLCYSLGTDYWVPRSTDLSEVLRLLRRVQNYWLRGHQLESRSELT